MPDHLALIFDLDGTLIDSVPQIHAAANTVFGNKGLPEVSREVVRGFVGNGLDALVNRLVAHHGIDAGPALHAALVAEFISIYEEAFDLTTLYPGVSTALPELVAAGHRLAVCTNKPLGPARAVLRHFGLDALFPVVIGGDSLPQRKPDPAPLLAAASALGDARRLFIGDSEVDAETAHAAGISFALFSGGYRNAAPETLGARVIFDHHAALPGLIDHLAPSL